MKSRILNVKRSTGLLAVLACSMQLSAQGVNYAWAGNMGGGGVEYGNAITADASGNVYVAGYFTGTGDFNPGTGTQNMTSAGAEDVYVVKLNPAGQMVWARQMGGTESDQAFAVAVDALGNVYSTGYFKGTADFDPGTGTANLTAAGTSADVFISKLDNNGNFKWVKQIGGMAWDQAAGIQVDRWGNVYTAGYFQSTVDFDPGAGTANLSTSGGFDIFISKLDSTGNYLWARKMGSSSSDFGNALAVDDAGSVYSTGIFQGTGDFDPGTGTANLVSAGNYEVFVSKLDSAGNYVWAKGLGGSGLDWGYGISVDAAHNVYTVGTFEVTADFDPGTGTSNLISLGAGDAFLSKLTATGDFAWAKQFGGTGNDIATAVTTDKAGNPILTGYFNNTVDFDPGAGTTNFTAVAADDIFTCKLNGSGTFKWAKQAGGASNDYSFAIKADASGNVYTAGTFSGIADFDPGAGTASLNSDVGGHAFAQKLVCVDTNSAVVTATACGSYTYNGVTYTASGTYVHKFANMSGCDSTVSLELSLNTMPPATISRTANVLSTANIYSSYQWFRNTVSIAGATNSTYTLTQNGSYTVAVANTLGCKDTSEIFTVSDVTGINGPDQLAAEISVYPNPASDMIHIKAPAGLEAILMSMEGRILKQFKNTTAISLRQFAPGMYWIRFTDKEGRFIKATPIAKNQ